MIDNNAIQRSDICRRRHESDWGPLSSEELAICREGLAAILEPQLQWLSKELAKSRSELKIVVGHKPIYGKGKWAFYSDDAGITLQEHLDPLLHREHIHAYISGHDHLFQHLTFGSVDYFVMGAGGGELDHEGRRLSSNATMVFNLEGSYGFSRIDITNTELCVTFVASNVLRPMYKYCKAHGVAPYQNFV